MTHHLTRSPQRSERRQRNRIQLSSPILARLGSHGAVLLDLSDGGARVEHYHSLNTGQATILRFEWESETVDLPCRVVGCRIARFASGDDGLTVYSSGLAFTEPDDKMLQLLRSVTTIVVARALAEQVANAKGVRPLDTDHMPIFRGGVLSSNEFESGQDRRNKHLIPIKKLASERGFVCYRLQKNGYWTRKWTMKPDQPEEGFTLSVHESVEQVELLCDSYMHADATGRALIRTMAAMSLETKS